MQKLKTILQITTDGEAAIREPNPMLDTAGDKAASLQPPAPTIRRTFALLVKGSSTLDSRIFSDWKSGYIADLHITNAGAGPVDGWTVTWEMSPGHNSQRYLECRVYSNR